jgi:hypothetical protein
VQLGSSQASGFAAKVTHEGRTGQSTSRLIARIAPRAAEGCVAGSRSQ